MIWLSNISDLGYYNRCAGVPCYCEALLYPSDLVLQGSIPAGQGSGNYGISIEVWSADGTTALEADNSNFDYYFFVNPLTQVHQFNIRLKRFTAAMCANKCFLIRVGVWNAGAPDAFLFANWTEQYCIASCCEFASNVTITQGGANVKTSTTVVTTNLQKACDTQIIRVISDTACINNQNGKFYNRPTNILSGSATFQYSDILNIRGRMYRVPREITVQRSFNCNSLRTESTKQYRLEGFEAFPEWKMSEIEDMLHTEYITVNDFSLINSEYKFSGGVAFEDRSIGCCRVMKLNAIMQDCNIRQNFGCDTSCGVSNYYFVIPKEGQFYNDASQLIANDIDGLLQWFQSQNGVLSVSEVDLSCLLTGSPPVIPCQVEAIISFQGTGAYPSSIYINYPTQSNRIYAIQTADICDVCDIIGITQCEAPVLGTPVVTEILCDAPVLGTPVITEITGETLTIEAYGNWLNVSPPVLDAVGYANSVVFNLELTNTSDYAGFAGETLQYSDRVAVIFGNGVPTISQNITYSGMPWATGDVTISIDTQGYITLTGEIVFSNDNELTIELSNVTYQLS